MRRLLVMAALGLTILFEREASASSGDMFALFWTLGAGAESCPSTERVARAVAAKLGRDPFGDPAKRAIFGRVERTAEAWSVHIDEVDGDVVVDVRDGESAAPDCSAVLPISAFLIARVIETGGAPRSTPPEPPPPPPPPASAPAPRQPEARPNPPPLKAPPRDSTQAVSLPSRGVEGTVFLGGITGFGLLPDAAPGFSVAGGAGRGRFEASSGMLFLPEVSSHQGTFSFGMTAGWLGGCVRAVKWGPASLLGCAQVLAGAVHVVVHEIDPYVAIDPGARGWAALSAALRVRLSLWGPVAAELGTDLLSPLTRLRFTAGDEVVFLQSPVIALPSARVGVTFF